MLWCVCAATADVTNSGFSMVNTQPSRAVLDLAAPVTWVLQAGQCKWRRVVRHSGSASNSQYTAVYWKYTGQRLQSILYVVAILHALVRSVPLGQPAHICP